MVVGKLPPGMERDVHIAGAAVLGGAALLSLLVRGVAHNFLGRHLHVERKAFFAYWFWNALSLGVLHLFMLYGLFDYDRDGAGRFVNWTRWVFYIFAFGICGNGIVAEFQLQPNAWTRYYTGATLASSFLLNGVAAFVDDSQARLMLGALSGVAIGLYIVQLLYFDGRFKDRMYSFFVSFLTACCIGVGIAMFVVGHANKRDITRGQEQAAWLAIEAFFSFVITMAMKYRWASRASYFAGIANAAALVEHGLFTLCFGAAATVDAATAPLTDAVMNA